MRELARRGKWKTMYLSQQTVEEIRELSELEGESKERLRRELELAKEEAERRRSDVAKRKICYAEGLQSICFILLCIWPLDYLVYQKD